MRSDFDQDIDKVEPDIPIIDSPKTGDESIYMYIILATLSILFMVKIDSKNLYYSRFYLY